MSAIETDRIVRRSLSEQVVERLKVRILSPGVEPGQRLLTDALAAEMGVSRTPVREGLKELVTEGLVTYDGKSYAVKIFSRRDAEEILSHPPGFGGPGGQPGRSQHHRRAAPGAARPAVPIRRRLDKGDIQSLVEIDFRFHELIADASLNSRLRMLTNGLREQIFLSHRWSFDPKQLVQTIAEHGRILQALLARNPEMAAQAMGEHLVHVAERTLARLS